MTDGPSASGQANDPAGADDTVPEQRDEQPTGMRLLARGVRWSDIVAEIERDHRLRDAA